MTQKAPKHSFEDVFTLFFQPGEVCEIRAIGCSGKGPWDGWAKGGGVVFGYFNDPLAFSKATTALEQVAPTGIYFTVNPVLPDFLGRANNRLKAADNKSKTTATENIVCYRWLLMDFDPVRPAGGADLNSSQEEFDRAWMLRNRIHEDIRKDRIATKGISAISGNGAHLNFRLPDLPNTEETKNKIRTALLGAKTKWADPFVDLDQKVIDANRIFKLYGTTARKSDHTDQRPQRVSHLQFAGATCPILADIQPNSKILEILGGFAPKDEQPAQTPAQKKAQSKKVLPLKRPRHPGRDDPGPVDVREYLGKYGIPITKEKPGSNNGKSYTYYELNHCLFNPEHKREAGISQESDGTLRYHCFHNSCSGYRFEDARAAISGRDSLAPFMAGYDTSYKSRPPEPPPHGTRKNTATPGASAAPAKEENFPTPSLPFLRYNRQGREVLNPALAADHFEEILKPVYCCTQENNFWQYKNSGVWSPLTNGRIKRTIRETLGDKAKPNWINQCVETLQAQCYRDDDEIESNPMFLNLKNGMWDVKKRELIPHDPAYLNRNQFPVSYDEDADCDLWLETLASTFKDDLDKIDTLQDFFGYCLYPKIIFPGVLFCIGDGGNGKGVVDHVLSRFLGTKSVCHISMKRMNEPFGLIGFKGKYINTVSETSPEKLDVTEFKQVSAGDEIETSIKYGGDVKFAPFTKHYISMNKFPHVTETTNSFFRRITVLEFVNKFIGNDCDPYLKDKLELCLDGVFLWALDGLYRVLANKRLSTPTSVKRGKDRFMDESNHIRIFVSEVCVLAPDATIKPPELYKRYQNWCMANGISKQFIRTNFYKKLCENYPGIHKTRGTTTDIFKGIGLSTECSC